MRNALGMHSFPLETQFNKAFNYPPSRGHAPAKGMAVNWSRITVNAEYSVTRKGLLYGTVKNTFKALNYCHFTVLLQFTVSISAIASGFR